MRKDNYYFSLQFALCLFIILCAVSTFQTINAQTPPPTPTPIPQWAYPPQEAQLSFDEYHKLPPELQKNYQLYFITNAYEQDPKWQSLSKIPGWGRDGVWSGLAVGEYIGGPTISDGSFWGSCPETASQTETSIKTGKEAFFAKYYPNQPPPEAQYVPENYDELVRKKQVNFAWDYSNEPIVVSFVGEDTNRGTNPVVHQLVKVYPKGHKLDPQAESYAFDPWGTGYPEVMPWSIAQGRNYTYSGDPYERNKFIWEKKKGGGGYYTAPPVNLPEYIKQIKTNRDNPDDNVNVGRSHFILKSGKADLFTPFYRLAKKKNMNTLVSIWQQHPEVLLVDGKTHSPMYFNPMRLYYAHHVAPMLISYSGKFVYDYLKDIYNIPEISILANGYYENLADLLADNGIPSSIISKQDIFNSLANFKVLIIPSGGIQGINNSDYFKQALESFVKNGGTLIVFCQPTGDLYLAAPGSNGLSAHGWQEDQSCVYRSTYISSFHPSIAGQDSVYPSLHIDGYFSKWTSSMKPVLMRTRNPVPSLITYKYGNGNVALSTCFADWAYLGGFSDSDDTAFIRDLCLWALYPNIDMVYNFVNKPISVPVNIINDSSKTITSIKFKVIDKFGNEIGEPIERTVNISPGTSEIVTLDLTAPPNRGIYQIDAELTSSKSVDYKYGLTAFAAVIQFPTDSGVTTQSEITAAVITDKEEYIANSPIHVDVEIFNTGTEKKTVDVKMQIPYIKSPFIKNGVEISGGSSTKVSFDATLTEYTFGLTAVWALIRDSNSQADLASSQKYIKCSQTDQKNIFVNIITKATLGTDYDLDSDVVYEISINKPYYNSQNDIWNFEVKIIDPSGAVVNTANFGAAPQPENFSYPSSYHIPTSGKIGTWTISCKGTFESNSGGTSTFFNVIPGFRSYLRAKDNNWTGIAGREMTFFAELKSTTQNGFTGSMRLQVPDAGFDQNIPNIILPSAEVLANQKFQVPLPIDIAPGFHKVILTTTREDNAKEEIKHNISVAQANVVVDLVSNQINAGENIVINILNNGGSNLSSLICDYNIIYCQTSITSGTQVLENIAPDNSKQLILNTPNDLKDGIYVINLACSKQPDKSWKFYLPIMIKSHEATIAAKTDKPFYKTSENINLSADYTFAGAQLSGAHLQLSINDNNRYINRFGLRECLKIDAQRIAYSSDEKLAVYGPTMGIKVYDKNNVYLAGYGDTVFDEPQIESGDIAFNSQNKLFVLNSKTNTVQIFSVGSSLTIDSSWQLKDSSTVSSLSIEVAPDDKVYISRVSNTTKANSAYIEIYSSAGVFEKQIGSYGSGDGQFINPTHLAVDNSGNVFICDSGNNRAIKIDNNGNHLLTFNCAGKLPSGIAYVGTNTYVLIEEINPVVSTKYIYTFNDAGAKTGESSIYLTRGRDMIQSNDSNNYLIVLEAYSIYGADVRFLKTNGLEQFRVTGIKNISGVAVLSDGTFVAADTSARVVWKYNKQSGLGVLINGSGNTLLGSDTVNHFILANDIAIDSANNIYIPDNTKNNVKIFNSAGQLIGLLPKLPKSAKEKEVGAVPPIFSTQPTKIWIDKNDNIYLYFSAESRVTKFDKNGNFIHSFTVHKPPSALDVYDMVVDSNEYVWLGCFDSLKVFTPDGTLINNFTDYSFIQSLDADDEGNVYLYSSRKKQLRKINASGNVKAAYDMSGLGSSFAGIKLFQRKIYFGLSSQGGFGEFEEIPLYLENINITKNISGTVNRTKSAADFVGQKIFGAALINRFGQELAYSSVPFLVSDNAIALNISTDKEIYAYNKEVAQLNLSVVNNSGVPISDTLVLKVKTTSSSKIIWEQLLALQNDQSFEFTLPYPVDLLSGEFILSYHNYSAATPLFSVVPAVDISINSPESAGKDPFDVNVVLTNNLRVPAEGQLTISTSMGSTSIDVNVPPNSNNSYKLPAQINKNDTISAQLSNGLSGSAQKSIALGPVISIKVTPPSTPPSGNVRIGYSINNSGGMETNVPVIFSAGGESANVSHVVPAGSITEGTFDLYLNNGEYDLTYISPYDSGSAKISVGQPEFSLSSGLSITTPKFSGSGVLAKDYKNGIIATINAGSNVTCSFGIKNISKVAGTADITLRLPGIFEDERHIYLEGGNSQEVSFKISIPEDLLSKTYPIEIILNGFTYKFSYQVNGISLTAEATLDKRIYKNGETATLKAKITNNAIPLTNLSVSINYLNHDDEYKIDLATGESKEQTFNFTVTESDQVSLQINSSDGRALFIDVLSVNVKDGVQVSVDKEAYQQFGTVNVTASADKATTVVLFFKSITNTLVFENPGTMNWAFTLPNLARGTYFLNYETDDEFGTVQFDVDGPEIVVNKAEIYPQTVINNSLISLILSMTPHQLTSAVFEFYVADELGNQITSWTENIAGLVNDTPTTISFQRQIAVNHSGIHSLTYAAKPPNTSFYVVNGEVIFDGIANEQVPKIIRVFPADASTNIPLTSSIIINFSTEMNKQLTESAFSINPSVKMNFFWSKPNILCATPDNTKLSPDTEYTCAVSKSAADLNDITLASDYVWKFKTGELVTTQTIKDIIIGKKILNPQYKTSFDYNNDGIIDIADIVYLINFLNNN